MLSEENQNEVNRLKCTSVIHHKLVQPKSHFLPLSSSQLSANTDTCTSRLPLHSESRDLPLLKIHQAILIRNRFFFA